MVNAAIEALATNLAAVELDIKRSYAASTKTRDDIFFDEKEEMTFEAELEDDIEEMGELSDSQSSHTSTSRPTTPSRPVISKTASSTDHVPFSLSSKAERILGLSRGSLAHARACLENARDEVRRLGGESGSGGAGGGSGMKGRMDRARKTMSVGYGRMPSFGKEEEEKHERRTRVAEGVMYWGKEVARLEPEEVKGIRR